MSAGVTDLKQKISVTLSFLNEIINNETGTIFLFRIHFVHFSVLCLSLWYDWKLAECLPITPSNTAFHTYIGLTVNHVYGRSFIKLLHATCIWKRSTFILTTLKPGKAVKEINVSFDKCVLATLFLQRQIISHTPQHSKLSKPLKDILTVF